MPVIFYLVAIISYCFSANYVDCDPSLDLEIRQLLQPLREKYQLPALAGAILDSGGLKAKAAVGVRKHGTTINATANDEWHLGSCGKALTSTMIARLVEKGNLSWTTTVGSVFADLDLPEPVSELTLLHLLSHRGGLPRKPTDWESFSNLGSLIRARLVAVAWLAQTELLFSPGTSFLYSNYGYVVAAAMAEHVTGLGYEDLMTLLVFEPLHMDTAGFGPPGTPGKVDQPWGHRADGSAVQDDLPLVITPAGLIHSSMDDWAKYILDQLRGSGGKSGLLKPESYARQQTAPFPGNINTGSGPPENYALGWELVDRPWGKGQVLMHEGSNGWNAAVVWMSPKLQFAVLVVTNKLHHVALEEASDVLIKHHLNGKLHF